MLTPIFKLSQDEDHVFINIHAPYTNVTECEIDADGDNFLFVSSPYFLRLRLPGRIVDNGEARGSYVCDTGDFKLKYAKEVPGENFENLDMITSLFVGRGIPDVNPSLVQEVDEGGITVVDDEGLPTEGFTYGFAGKLTKDFCEIGKEFPQIFELRAPERIAVDQRHSMRIQYEDHKFSADHYLADLYEDELVGPYITAVAPWNKPDFTDDIEFNDTEIGILKELPNKHYILTKKEHKEVFLGLVDILYAYCYDKRSTMFESTLESNWTINKVSPTFTWFVTYDNMKEVLVACYRRAVTFPIYRNFSLCNKVKEDLQTLMGKGKTFVIKCMIDVYTIFNTSCTARYILNQLYVKDYLIFLQKCKEEEFQELAKNITEIELTKSDLSLQLDTLEATAALVQNDGADVTFNELALKLANMDLIPGLYTYFQKHHMNDNSDFNNDVNDQVDSELNIPVSGDLIDDVNNGDDDDEDGWVTSSSVPSASSSDDSSDESSSSEELDSDDDSS